MFWKLFISALLHFTSPLPIRADHLQATFKASLNHFDRLGKRIIALFCNQAGRAQDTPTTERSWPDILSKALQIKKRKKEKSWNSFFFKIFSQNNAKCLSNHSKEYFSLSMLVPVIVSEQELFRVSLKKTWQTVNLRKKNTVAGKWWKTIQTMVLNNYHLVLPVQQLVEGSCNSNNHPLKPRYAEEHL